MCSVSVHSTHLWCTAWKVFCSCAQYTFMMYLLESVLFLCTVHISDVPSGKCSVSVHSTHFWRTVWKVFYSCAQYTFLMYRVESVPAHNTYCWCAVWKMFCFCAQYTFLMLSAVIFLSEIYSLVQKQKFLCCLDCFVVISPLRRRFQSLSKHVTAIHFLTHMTDTKYSSYTRIRVRYDVVSLKF